MLRLLPDAMASEHAASGAGASPAMVQHSRRRRTRAHGGRGLVAQVRDCAVRPRGPPHAPHTPSGTAPRNPKRRMPPTSPTTLPADPMRACRVRPPTMRWRRGPGHWHEVLDHRHPACRSRGVRALTSEHTVDPPRAGCGASDEASATWVRGPGTPIPRPALMAAGVSGRKGLVYLSMVGSCRTAPSRAGIKRRSSSMTGAVSSTSCCRWASAASSSAAVGTGMLSA